MNIAIISDLHCPYQHSHAFDFIRDILHEYKPEIVVNIGDEIDNFSLSKYEHPPEMVNADQEMEMAIKELRPLMQLCPNMLLCTSNHVERLYKRGSEAGIPRRAMRNLNEILNAPPGWIWKDEHVLEGHTYKSKKYEVTFFHGDNFTGKDGARQAAVAYRTNIVMGHAHAWAGVYYDSGKKNQLWGMNVGCLVDVEHPAFRYAKHARSRPTLGMGMVIEGMPHFFAME